MVQSHLGNAKERKFYLSGLINLATLRFNSNMFHTSYKTTSSWYHHRYLSWLWALLSIAKHAGLIGSHSKAPRLNDITIVVYRWYASYVIVAMLDVLCKGFSFFAILISSNMVKFSLSYKSSGNRGNPPIRISCYLVRKTSNKLVKLIIARTRCTMARKQLEEEYQWSFVSWGIGYYFM